MQDSSQLELQGDGMNSVLRPPAFVPFNEQKAVRIYHRNLPHWRQEGCTYFVTFRLGDSIPDGVRKEWEYEQSMWLKARGITYDGPRGSWRSAVEKLPAKEQFQFHKHFNRQVQSCLDRGLGECWLRQAACVDIVRHEHFAHDGQSYDLGDLVLMPNHVHALLTPRPGHELEDILKRIKGASAVGCNRQVQRSGTFWQADSYDHIVRSLEELVFFREYIATNPKSAGIDIVPNAMYRADWMDAWFDS